MYRAAPHLECSLLAFLRHPYGIPTVSRAPEGEFTKQHALGVPLITVEEAAAGPVVLMPICFDAGAIRVGLPGGGRSLAFSMGPRGGDRVFIRIRVAL